MPTPPEYRARFCPGTDFHLLFKSHGGLFLFRSEENHRYFLQKFTTFLLPVFKVYAWSSLANHAHFVVQVREPGEVVTIFKDNTDLYRSIAVHNLIREPNARLLPSVVERQINSMMASYTLAYNKYFDRKGGLFQSPFRRSLIEGREHLTNSILYVHKNAQQHGLVNDFRKYPYSSYSEICKGYSSIVDVNEVLRIFGGKEAFINAHVH